MEDPVQKALHVLNDALERDPDALTRLVNMRVECNPSLASHPTIQVGVYDGVARVGVLGLINAALGDSPRGAIGAKGTVDAKSGLFRRIHAFVDMRDEGLDVIA